MSAFTLKIIAALSMLLDHTAYAFQSDMPDWTYLVLRGMGYGRWSDRERTCQQPAGGHWQGGD